MSHRIGIISDTHSSVKPLTAALDIFKKEKVDSIICAGDIAGYGEDELIETIHLLQKNNCLCIAGNHDEAPATDQPLLHTKELQSFFTNLQRHQQLTIESKSIYIVHASPPDLQHGGIKLLDQEGKIINKLKQDWEQQLSDFNYDILIVGHTHQVFAETIANTLVINPGSTLYNHSCIILSLPEMKVTIYALQGKKIVKSWNWGLYFKEQRQ